LTWVAVFERFCDELPGIISSSSSYHIIWICYMAPPIRSSEAPYNV